MSKPPRRGNTPSPDELLQQLLAKKEVTDQELTNLNRMLRKLKISKIDLVKKLGPVRLDSFKAVIISRQDGRDRDLPSSAMELISECTVYRNLTSGMFFARAANWAAKIAALQTANSDLDVGQIDLVPLILRRRPINAHRDPEGSLLVYKSETFGKAALLSFFKLDLRYMEEERSRIEALSAVLGSRLRDLFRVAKADANNAPEISGGMYLAVLEIALHGLAEEMSAIRVALADSEDTKEVVLDFKMQLLEVIQETSEGLEIEAAFAASYPKDVPLIRFASYGHSPVEAPRSVKNYWKNSNMPLQARHMLLVGGPRSGKTFVAATAAEAFHRSGYKCIFGTYKNLGGRKTRPSDTVAFVDQPKECNNFAASLAELGCESLYVLKEDSPCGEDSLCDFIAEGGPRIGYIEFGQKFLGTELIARINKGQNGKLRKVVVFFDEAYNYLIYDKSLISKLQADSNVLGARDIWACLIDQELHRITGTNVASTIFQDELMPPLEGPDGQLHPYTPEVHQRVGKEILKPIAASLRSFSKNCVIVASNLKTNEDEQDAFKRLLSSLPKPSAWEVDFSDVQKKSEGSRGQFVLFPTTGSGHKYPIPGETAKSRQLSENSEVQPVPYGLLKLSPELFFRKNR